MDILGTKGETSAGRPAFTMAAEVWVTLFDPITLSLILLPRSGYDRFLALLQNGERHRAGRNYLHGAIGPQHARGYASSQEEQTVRFLRKLLNDPEDFEEHCKW